MKIGYRDYEDKIMNSDLPEWRKEAWKTFEDVREALAKKYHKIIKNNRRLENILLSSVLKDVHCNEGNRNTEAVLKQWEDLIRRYAKKERFEQTRKALLDVLNQFAEKN